MSKSPLSHDAQLVKMARSIARLETKARELRRQLADVDKRLRSERKQLKGYAQFVQEPQPPMRLFGGSK